MNKLFTAIIHKEGNLYVAECPEVGTASQGESIEEAINNLKEATELYLEEFPQQEVQEFPQQEVQHPLLTTFEVTVNG